MTLSPQSRLALVWLLLSGITLFAWWIGAHHSAGTPKADGAVAVGAIAITVVKVRVIISEFMDERHAPRLLRYVVNGWLALFVVAMLAAYFL